MHCENFATIAQISQSQRNFAIIVKVTVHSENLNFAMPCILAMIAKFQYHSEIFAMIAKFRYHSEIFAMIAKFTA